MKPGPQCSFPQSLVLLDVTDPRYMPPPNSPQTKEVFFSFQIKVFPKTTISHESANLSAGEPKRVVVGVGRVPELTAPHTAASSTLTATGSRPTPSPSRLTVTVTGSGIFIRCMHKTFESLKPKTVEVSLSRPTAPQPGRNGEIVPLHGCLYRGPRSQRTHNLKTDKNNRHF